MFFKKAKAIKNENEFLKKQLKLRDDMLSEAVRKLEKYLPDEAPAEVPEGYRTIFVRSYYKIIKE